MGWFSRNDDETNLDEERRHAKVLLDARALLLNREVKPVDHRAFKELQREIRATDQRIDRMERR
jgi:hypothetical protein